MRSITYESISFFNSFKLQRVHFILQMLNEARSIFLAVFDIIMAIDI